MKISFAGIGLAVIFSSVVFPARSPLCPASDLQKDDPAKSEASSSRLTPQDKGQLQEFLRVKDVFGRRIWPGLDTADVPVIQHNGAYAFLVGHPAPPPPWAAVDDDTFAGGIYYRRPAETTQAFAIRVGDLWAASLDTLAHMNLSMKNEIRKNVPPEKITPFLLKTMEITPSWHVAALIHEALHAFQAKDRFSRFQRSTAAYSMEGQYPFVKSPFTESWNAEGMALASALLEKEGAKRLSFIERFLNIRETRRTVASLAAELVAFERDLEWLEGLAKYAELRICDLASTDTDEEKARSYSTARSRLRMDFFSRLRKLGEISGDGRFYLSGAAQAMLLDLIRPEWKAELWPEETVGLEDLLTAAKKTI